MSGSAKRKAIYLKVASFEGGEQQLLELLTEDDVASESAQAIKEGSRRNTVPKFCATRWTAKISTLSALLAKYAEVLKALEAIRDSSTGDARSDTASYIRFLEDSQFLTVAQFILNFLGSVTTSLQCRDCNLAGAYNDVALAKECIHDSRNDSCWKKSVGQNKYSCFKYRYQC